MLSVQTCNVNSTSHIYVMCPADLGTQVLQSKGMRKKSVSAAPHVHVPAASGIHVSAIKLHKTGIPSTRSPVLSRPTALLRCLCSCHSTQSRGQSISEAFKDCLPIGMSSNGLNITTSCLTPLLRSMVCSYFHRALYQLKLAGLGLCDWLVCFRTPAFLLPSSLC